MPEVRVLLFGLKDGAAGKTQLAESISPGTTVEDLWLRLKSLDQSDGRIATVDRAALLVLVNGQPIDYLDGWKTQLAENDQITYLRRAVGG